MTLEEQIEAYREACVHIKALTMDAKAKATTQGELQKLGEMSQFVEEWFNDLEAA